jgi:hypothetical protein
MIFDGIHYLVEVLLFFQEMCLVIHATKVWMIFGRKELEIG